MEYIIKLNPRFDGKYLLLKLSRFNIRIEKEMFFLSPESKTYEKMQGYRYIKDSETILLHDYKNITPEKIIDLIQNGYRRIIIYGNKHLLIVGKFLDCLNNNIFNGFDQVYSDSYIHKNYEYDIDIIILIREYNYEGI